MALASIFLVLADSGLFLHQSRTYPSLIKPEDISRFMADGVSLRIWLGIISGIILVVIGFLSGKGIATTNFISLLAISILFVNVMGGYSSYLYGTERFGLYGIVSSGTQLITSGMGFLVLYAGWGLVGIGWAQVAGSLITLLVVRAVVRNKISWPSSPISSPRLFSLYKQSIPLGIVAIILVFYNRINFTLVSIFSGDNAAGIYNAAFGLINGIALLASTFATVLLPRFSILWNSDNQTLKNLYGVAFRYLLILGMGLAFGVTVLAKPLMAALFSDKYLESAQPLVILSFAGIFLFLNSLQQVIIIARRANHQLIRMVVITSAANLLVALILIPNIGYKGAAVAMLAGECLGFIYGFAINRNTMDLRRVLIIIGQVLPASILIIIPLKYGGSLPFVIPLVLAYAAYFIMLFMLGGLNKTDLGILMGALRK